MQQEDGGEARDRRASLVSVQEGLVMVWGSEPPAFSIGWMEPLGSWDSGFTVIFDDAPDPEELEGYESLDDHPGIRAMHLACLLEEHPEIGRGLDIAREHLVADLADDGEWIVGDVTRLEEKRSP
jgi:hypothetical protein